MQDSTERYRSLWRSGIFRKFLVGLLVLSLCPLILFGQRSIERVRNVIERQLGSRPAGETVPRTEPVGSPRSEAEAMATDLYVVLGIASVLIVATAVALCRGITRPIHDLTRAVARVGRGELRQEIPVGSQDEIGDLARTFNQMCRDLEHYQAQLRSAERFASIGETISGTAHALKTELNIYGLINNAAVLARFTPDSDPRHKYVDAVREGLERLESVIRMLLSPVPEIRKSSLNLADQCRAVAEAFENRARDLHVEIRCGLPGHDCHVEGDSELLRQVLSSLAENALDAMPEGGTLVFQCERGENQIVVRIADTGVGMPPEQCSKVLFPFYTTKRDSGGTGLGLYQAYRIVRRHGGTLELESEEGHGTTVTLKFPSPMSPAPELSEQI